MGRHRLRGLVRQTFSTNLFIIISMFIIGIIITITISSTVSILISSSTSPAWRCSASRRSPARPACRPARSRPPACPAGT